MTKPRTLIKSLLVVALFTGASLLLGGARPEVQAQRTGATIAAADDTTRGIELYKQGDDKGAIEALRRVIKQRKNDIVAWHYLGLAYARQGKTGDARKAHEKAAKGGEVLLDQLYSSLPYESVPAAAAKYKSLLITAADSAVKYLELSSKPSRSKIEEWNVRVEMLREYAELSEERSGDPTLTKVYNPRQVETKARVLSKPEPSYTEAARQKQVSGTVVIRCIFAFDGKVRGIRVVEGLPEGLTLRSVEAARRIKFIPATINGKPVSQYIQIEYNFNLY